MGAKITVEREIVQYQLEVNRKMPTGTATSNWNRDMYIHISHTHTSVLKLNNGRVIKNNRCNGLKVKKEFIFMGVSDSNDTNGNSIVARDKFLLYKSFVHSLVLQRGAIRLFYSCTFKADHIRP